MDKTKIAVIDFDGTLFNGESMPFIWKRYGELGYSKTRQMRALFKIIVVKFFADKYVFKSSGESLQVSIAKSPPQAPKLFICPK